MFEFHGWATIRETPHEVDRGNLETIVDRLREKIRSFGWTSGLLQLQSVNGEYQLHVAGLTNHRSKQASDITELYNDLAAMAPGSYGLLYVRDDEVPNAGERNSFEVWVLARGSLRRASDTLLSPCLPVVEDAE